MRRWGSRLTEGRMSAWVRDYLVFWWDGVRYWLDVELRDDQCVFLFRRWDREQPIKVFKCHRLWFYALERQEVKEKAMAYLKRAAAGEGAKEARRSQDDLAWAAAHPALNEYLTADKYPDGGQRTTATLLLFYEAPEWKACLRDRDTARTLWCSAGSLPELFEAIDGMLQSDDAAWRKDRPQQHNGGKKRG